MTNLQFGHVNGLTATEQANLLALANALDYHQSRNATKDKYYEGHITLNDVNLGIALPDDLKKLDEKKLVEFANEILQQLRLVSYKYK